MMNNSDVLSKLFGENRAEWPHENFNDIFVSPAYMSKLTSRKPCVLIGGRGTGKTTALQSLRYNDFYQRVSGDGAGLSDMGFFGIYIKINKNRVKAFQGEMLKEEDWRRAFSHYINLLICKELCLLAIWLEEHTGRTIGKGDIRAICIHLGVDKVDEVNVLLSAIHESIAILQVYVNNPSPENCPSLSPAEAPVIEFCEALETAGFLKGKMLFCCLDEYENLTDYQQAVINAFIKNAAPPISYKIGVRKNGFRTKSTIDCDDPLESPHDYNEIDIVTEGFELFAKEVMQKRLSAANSTNSDIKKSTDEFLASMTLVEEAKELGAHRVSEKILKELVGIEGRVFDYFKNISPGKLYFLEYWRQKEGGDIQELAVDWYEKPEQWETRFGNHGFSSLFWLSKGNKGVRIKKYYCGLQTFLSMAGGNIRYFLDLIDAGIKRQQEAYPDQVVTCLSPVAQTLGAKDVGKRRLEQLEDLSENGIQLKRLVLAIGKIFFEYARSPLGKAPETTSFSLAGSVNDVDAIKRLLLDGVAHLAFEVQERNKHTSIQDMKDEEFRLHRIFSAFFEISYRKKRRAQFPASVLLDILGDKPGNAISRLVRESNDNLVDEPLPEQLGFFSNFYRREDG